MARTKTTKKSPGGRPRAMNSPTELDQAIVEYKQHCDDNEEIFTIIGLACHMGIHKDTLFEYAKMEKYSDSYKKALSYAENDLVKNSINGKYNSTVSIFLLKNNHGYTDKQEIKQDITADVTQKVIWE